MKKLPQTARKSRRTLFKNISAARTDEEKLRLSAFGGYWPTAIQNLPFDAYRLRKSLHGDDWLAVAREKVKQRFADLMFPALLNGEQLPFVELLKAIQSCNRFKGDILTYVKTDRGTKRIPSRKKEQGRILRSALLNLAPDDFRSLKTIKAGLARLGVTEECPEDSELIATIRGDAKRPPLGIPFLLPGKHLLAPVRRGIKKSVSR